MANPLLTRSTLPFELPDYARLTDADFREALLTGMSQQLEELRAVAESTEPATVENVLEAWERTGATLDRALEAFWTAMAADTNDTRDEIDAEISPLLAAHADAILLDRGLYDRLRALAERSAAGEVELDLQSAHLLRERLRDYERGGIHLDGAAQDRLRELNAELATLETRFAQLVVAGRNAAAVHVTDEAELDGLSEEQREAARAAAESAGQEGWLLTLTNTSVQPLLVSLHHRPPASGCTVPRSGVVSKASTTPGRRCCGWPACVRSAHSCSATRTTRRTSPRTAAPDRPRRSTSCSPGWPPG